MHQKDTSRQLTTKVKTAKSRKNSSTLWLNRQLNDPYVLMAKKEGYRSRAAYKLLEIDKKFKLFKPGQLVVDLGAAPGGWSQIAIEKIINNTKKGLVIALDLIEMEPIDGVLMITGDFTEQNILAILKQKLPKKLDIVMSDMAANASGHQNTDHLRIVSLCELALDFALDHLQENGIFITKILRGGDEEKFFAVIKQKFKKARYFKPNASRADSAEMYIIAQDLK